LGGIALSLRQAGKIGLRRLTLGVILHQSVGVVRLRAGDDLGPGQRLDYGRDRVPLSICTG
jgi:hypothetical protein